MSEVQALRAYVQEQFTKKNGVKLGLMSFFVKATVEALKAVPVINGRIEGDDVIHNNFYDIGVAVGTERGLVVPVVRDADKKSFAELERDIANYAKKAREGKLKIEELQGGTFTISNGGVYGSLMQEERLDTGFMAPQRRATRIGTSARQTASAVFQPGEKKIAASNSAVRRILAARAKTDSLPNSMVRLISEVSRQISAKSRGVRAASQVSGRPRWMARTAGRVAAAASRVVGDTMRMRKGTSLARSKLGDRKTRRR